jgi:phosphatidate cytidylyltransferase
MLKTRIATALALLVVLLPILYFEVRPAVLLVAGLFMAAAIWESARLFSLARPILNALVWTAVFAAIVVQSRAHGILLLCILCVLIWLLRLVPMLKLGPPPIGQLGNRLLHGVYAIAILGCFTAVVALFSHSSLYLLSVMVIVWIADIGAYFVGRAFGKHKLAPAISPGKSWEGALGGWILVLLAGVAATAVWPAADTLAAHVRFAWGWFGLAIVLTLIVAASVVGDLVESQLKRRAAVKDSSNLLPGHGGVLDRVDSLIPVLPLAVWIGSWL